MSDGLKAFDDTSKQNLENEQIILEDIVVIGNAEPDELSDGRKTVCTVGYHPKYGLMRIYPVPPNAPMKRWNVVKIPLEKNTSDSRHESWKIQGSKEKQLATKIEVQKQLSRKEQLALLDELMTKYSYDCVEDIYEQNHSLGFIKPSECSTRFVNRPEQDATVQKNLFSQEPFLTIHNYDVQPRMKYRCPKCKSKNPHDQQILEWGVYEGIRKNPLIKEKILEGLHIDDSTYDKKILVGNMFLHRSKFMVISVYRFKR